ncbi:hypothetical protein IMY05_C4911000100 [Salix suchowensis]|nr:hypothetical protein IMY05_C4911000100 [Salix suchowensis]
MSADKADNVANLPPMSDERLSPKQQKAKMEVVKATVKLTFLINDSDNTVMEPPIPHSTPTAAQTTTSNTPPNPLATMSATPTVITKQGSKCALPVPTPSSSSNSVKLLAKVEAFILKPLGKVGIGVSKELLTELSKLNPRKKKECIQD